jgi:pimeloyl-ACP methyl ester carboxylesterase
VTIARAMGQSTERTMAIGMFLSVICAEDVPFIPAGAIEREAEGTFFGAGPALQMAAACELWPRGQVPPGFRDPVASDVPVLLLSGALDPVTPPSWAEQASATLRRSASVVFTGTGHNAATTACARRIAASFVERGTEKGLDTACAGEIPRPRFFATFAGAP